MTDEIEVEFGAPTPEPTPFTPLAHLAPPFPEVAMSEETPVVSPTGKPVVDSQLVIKVATALVGVAAIVTQMVPPHTIAFKVASAVIAFGAMFGIMSQGVRKA